MAFMPSSTDFFREWAKYKYISREEDMGMEGLGNQKSYFPAFMVNKYLVRCQHDGAAHGGKMNNLTQRPAYFGFNIDKTSGVYI